MGEGCFTAAGKGGRERFESTNGLLKSKFGWLVSSCHDVWQLIRIEDFHYEYIREPL
jgi:hypothetical protein